MTETVSPIDPPLPEEPTLPPPPSENPLLTIVKIITLLMGLGLTMLGCAFALLIGLGIFLNPLPPTPADMVVIVGVFVVSLLFGGALTVQAGQALRKRASAPFRLPRWWLLLLLYIGVLAIGQILIQIEGWAIFMFPTFHIMAAIFPTLLIVGLVRERLSQAAVTWREMTIALAGGVFVAPFIAIMVELLVGLIVFVVAIIGFMFTPDGEATIDAWTALLQDPNVASNPDNVSALINFPPLLIAFFVVFVIVGPTIEELTKPIAMIGLSYRRPTKAQAWLWGLAGGAGFALLENIFNTLAGLDAWIVIMLVRFGATLMHCFGSGLIALGWQHLVAHQRPWYLLGALATSIGLHALWNGTLVIVIGLAFIFLDNETVITLGGGLGVVMMMMLTLTIIAGFVGITRRLQSETSNL